MPINPIAKLNFMRKRLAHGIKRTDEKAYTGEKKINSDTKQAYNVKVQKHKLKEERYAKQYIKLQTTVSEIKKKVNNKGEIANKNANEKIQKLKSDFRSKFKHLDYSTRAEARKLRQANIILDKLRTLGTSIVDLPGDVMNKTKDANLANKITSAYVGYMKERNLTFSELNRKDAALIKAKIKEAISNNSVQPKI